MALEVSNEITTIMLDYYHTYGKSQFTSGEIVDYLRDRFPALDTNSSRVSAALAGLKKKGIALQVGTVEESHNGRAKYWSLTEIVDAETAPVTPAETTPTAAVKEVAEMAHENATSRKPREGTPEHMLMKISRVAEMQAATTDAAIENTKRLEIAVTNVVRDLLQLGNDQKKAGNDLAQAQLDAMNRLRDGILGTVGVIAEEIAITRRGNQHVESNIQVMLESIDNADEVDRNGYKRGFLDGFQAGRAQEISDRTAPQRNFEIKEIVLGKEVKEELLKRIANGLNGDSITEPDV